MERLNVEFNGKDEDTLNTFRVAAQQKFLKQGALKKAIIEAMMLWLGKQK